MIEYLLLGIAFIAVLVSAISDIKTREVPDWVSYGLIFAALGIRLLYSFGTFEWNYLIEGALGFVLFFLFGTALFYLGQWGGGDAKLLMGLGAVFGFQLHPAHNAIGFVLNLLIVGGAYGIFWAIFLSIKHWKKVGKNFSKLLQKKEVYYGRLVTVGLGLVLITVSFFFKDWFVKLPLVVSAAIIVAFFYLFLLMRSIENICFHKRISVDRLTEGDWVLKEVRVKGKTLASPKDLGLTKKQIQQLKRNKVKAIYIKEGMPFVPSFFIAFVITLIWGNLFLLLL